MGLRYLTVTTSGNTAANMADASGKEAGAVGVITDVELSGGTDTSADITIADPVGTVFSVTSVDLTTTLRYKVDDAAIKRNAVAGKLTVTPANTTGAAVVRVWVSENR